jgi:hypothetical protein
VSTHTHNYAHTQVLAYARVHPELLGESVTVSRQAAATIGTTANLHTGDVLSVQDLLYGLMLPSGNDAAVVRAHSACVWGEGGAAMRCLAGSTAAGGRAPCSCVWSLASPPLIPGMQVSPAYMHAPQAVHMLIRAPIHPNPFCCYGLVYLLDFW